MKIILALLFIISLAISARIDGDHSSFETPLSETKSRFAMLDDVQLLANGLLQLGRGLKDFAVKTKGQMDDIFQKLNIFDQSFNVISQQTNKIKEEEEELKKTTSRLQVNNEEIRNLSLQLNSKIEILSQEKIHLQNKVGRLEETLTKLHQPEPEIQETEEIASLKLSSPDFQVSKQISFPLKEDEIKNTQRDTTVRGQDYKDNATDCTWIYNRGELSDGIYSVKPNGSKAFDVYCEMKSESSWTVIQNRSDGSLDFNQTWDNYINGFGNLEGEFWLGLHKIYSIVDQADYILRIELEDWKANKRYIEYTFVMGGPETDYAVRLSKITGNISSALPEEKVVKFSTKDRDNTEQRVSCPESDSGGWWYTACEETNLNGKYIKPSSKGKFEKKKRGLYWKPQKGRPYLLKSTKLMIQPTDFENFD
ncbi:angiopoietin-related protein 3 [Tiliqua scincoides]|uniref:angiopoietin-related protein 3 n=1 Tax=Tiliqua scincoides TaxID=71010 RepID=UPI00346188E6